MDLDIYRGKGDATPKKTNFSTKKGEKKKKKIASWRRKRQDPDISQPSLPGLLSFLSLVEHRYTSRPFAFHSPPLIALYLAIPSSTDRQLPPNRSCTSVKKATRSLHHRELCLVRPLPPSHLLPFSIFYVAPVEGDLLLLLLLLNPLPGRSFPPPRS